MGCDLAATIDTPSANAVPGSGKFFSSKAGKEWKQASGSPGPDQKSGNSAVVAQATTAGKLHRLLLRQAVERAEAEHEIHRVDADDGAVFEQLAEDAEGDAVVRVVESRHDDAGVADVEIRVARRQPD